MSTALVEVVTDSVDVLGLDPAGTLEFAVARRKAAEREAAEELRAVAHWADLHACNPVHGAIDPGLSDDIARRSMRHFAATGSNHLPGLEGELRLAGQGAFRVEEFAVCELATALGMSEPAGRAYVGQALELRDRLPRLFAAVMAGVLPAWKARQVAEQTIPLVGDAVDYVDRHLSGIAHKLTVWQTTKCVEAAILRYDPDLAAQRAAAEAEKRGVWVEDRIDGTSTVNAVASTPDARALDASLNEVATVLGALGDPDSRDVRRSKALGVLADPQYALDLTTPGATPDAVGHSPAMHLHLHTDALETGNGVVRVDGVGARSFAGVEDWLRQLRPGVTIKVTPVVDLTDHLSVNAYEVPDRLRRQVDHRDPTCRFPWCQRQAKTDLDHTVPWVPPDEGGPPGQTATSNLTRLCRFHHRVKTHGGWTYQRTHDTEVTWTSPLGRVYLVDEHGTTLPQG